MLSSNTLQNVMLEKRRRVAKNVKKNKNPTKHYAAKELDLQEKLRMDITTGLIQASLAEQIKPIQIVITVITSVMQFPVNFAP